MINPLIDVKRGIRILKYFKVTMGLQKVDSLGEDLLVLLMFFYYIF